MRAELEKRRLQADVVIPAAMSREAKGDSEGADTLLEGVLRRHPENQDAAWLLGLSRLGLRKKLERYGVER